MHMKQKKGRERSEKGEELQYLKYRNIRIVK